MWRRVGASVGVEAGAIAMAALRAGVRHVARLPSVCAGTAIISQSRAPSSLGDLPPCAPTEPHVDRQTQTYKQRYTETETQTDQETGRRRVLRVVCVRARHA